jgi:hypothetical protein
MTFTRIHSVSVPTEVWFRNPRQYIRQLVEYGETRLVWLRGDLVKKRIEPVAYIKSFYGPSRQWRALVIATTGAHEYTHESVDETDFKACYPVWQFGESMAVLEALCADNVGDNLMAITDPTVEPFYRPRYGQEHRVVIIDLPPVNTGAGRRFMSDLAEIQENNPHCIIHVSGNWSYTSGFGFGLRSMDWDPHFFTGKNKLFLPSGREVPTTKLDQEKHGKWVNVLGFSCTQEQFQDLGKVLEFNVASANWAGKFYMENENFRVRHNISKRQFEPQPTQSNFTSKPMPLKAGDMVTCDTCSRADKCKYYRANAVCSVPGANVTELAKHFRTRDSEVIIDGLGALVALEMERINEGRENEVEGGYIDKGVTDAIDKAFKHGTDLAKLVDPALRSPKLAVQINNGVGGGSNINVLAATAVKALEAQGIPRSEQTPERLRKAIGAVPPIIEGEVVEDGS